MNKSTVDEIRRRFDADVERFSNLETGQSATVDAPLAMNLIAEAAAAVTPQASQVLDIGCGAGNYTLKLLQQLPNLHVRLVDLSRPMLDRAVERIRPVTNGGVEALQTDVRDLSLDNGCVDIILAAAVLHHLRSDDDWESLFRKFHGWLRPRGSVWIFDLVDYASTPIRAMMRRRYGQYLTALKDEAYRDQVFAYVEQEDTPRPLTYQLRLLEQVGFRQTDVLHANSCFAAFGAVKE